MGEELARVIAPPGARLGVDLSRVRASDTAVFESPAHAHRDGAGIAEPFDGVPLMDPVSATIASGWKWTNGLGVGPIEASVRSR